MLAIAQSLKQITQFANWRVDKNRMWDAKIMPIYLPGHIAVLLVHYQMIEVKWWGDWLFNCLEHFKDACIQFGAIGIWFSQAHI